MLDEKKIAEQYFETLKTASRKLMREASENKIDIANSMYILLNATNEFIRDLVFAVTKDREVTKVVLEEIAKNLTKDIPTQH